jgi:hypothetical protein
MNAENWPCDRSLANSTLEECGARFDGNAPGSLFPGGGTDP